MKIAYPDNKIRHRKHYTYLVRIVLCYSVYFLFDSYILRQRTCIPTVCFQLKFQKLHGNHFFFSLLPPDSHKNFHNLI